MPDFLADGIILVFAKAPVAGQVKTRLIAELGAEAASQLHQTLVEQRLAELSDAALCSVRLLCAPDCRHAFFRACEKRFGIELASQQGDTLGERMYRAMREAHRRYHRVAVVGCDAPALSAPRIAAALHALGASVDDNGANDDGNDLALIPAEDGGYVLLASRGRIERSLFEGIDWGSERVLAQTLEAARLAGLKAHVGSPCWDIDRPEDYRRYLRWKQAAQK